MQLQTEARRETIGAIFGARQTGVDALRKKSCRTLETAAAVAVFTLASAARTGVAGVDIVVDLAAITDQATVTF